MIELQHLETWKKRWVELVRNGRPGSGRADERPNLVIVPEDDPTGIVPMPLPNVLGPGRNRAFRLPQYFTTLGGLRTAFADAGEGPPLVFLHGLAGDATHWVHVAPRFCGTHRVICIDLPACGESEAPRGPLSVRLYAEQVHALMDRLGLERTAIVGHSLGGMVAAELALLVPGRVSQLVLLNPAGFQQLPLWLRAAGHLLLRPALLGRVLPQVWKRILDLVFAEKNDYTRGFVRSIEETYRVEDIHGIARVIAGLRHDFLDRDFLDLLDRLEPPTLLAWGAADLLTPAKALRATAQRMRNVTTHEIPRCGHLPMIERPETVFALLREHLRPAPAEAELVALPRRPATTPPPPTAPVAPAPSAERARPARRRPGLPSHLL
ncbi:MAG: alpha/beta hydrolase [Deltaproteobacteria bacterium]|nr:alpha/beta hydrolase [Deltaproteobacteria bacterium]